jgi:cytidyltransferase-like protein
MKPLGHKAENAKTSPPHTGVETGKTAGSPARHPPYEWGCVHGRFQPFHNGHLEYVLRAKVRCRQLIVGITNPDPTGIQAEASSPHRHDPEANPFTYLERATMVRDALLDKGLAPREFLIVPFPIHDPDLYRHYAPADAVHFIRVYSNWEQEKVCRLKAQGFLVEILDPSKEKEVSGADVRLLMRSSLPWEHLVPDTTVRIVREARTTSRPCTR